MMRKKTLPYKDWIERTLTSKEEIELVSHILLSAPNELQEYYQIDKDGHQIT